MARPKDYYPLVNEAPPPVDVDGAERRQVTVRVSAQPLAAERKWDLSCANCFGNCDGVGWGVCCLTTWCFPCMFGFLKYRLFGDFKKALGWALLFTLICFIPQMYRHIFFEDEDLSDDDGEYSEITWRDGERVRREDFSEDSSDSMVVKPQYSDHAKAITAVYVVMVLVCWAGIAVSGAYNRRQMRKKFGITASGMCCECAPEMEDSCLWLFCHSCATCQEARTLITNRVENGEWQGPLGTVTVQTAATGVPVPGAAAVPITTAVAPFPQDFDAPAKV